MYGLCDEFVFESVLKIVASVFLTILAATIFKQKTVEVNQIGIGRPVADGDEGGQETLAPSEPQDVAKGSLGGVEQANQDPGYGPLVGSLDLNGKIRHSFPHPIQYGHAAIGRTSQDTSESKELLRNKAVAMSCSAGCIGATKPSLAGKAIYAAGICKEGGIGLRPQEGREHQ
jgi:hypothetical protein